MAVEIKLQMRSGLIDVLEAVVSAFLCAFDHLPFQLKYLKLAQQFLSKCILSETELFFGLIKSLTEQSLFICLSWAAYLTSYFCKEYADLK